MSALYDENSRDRHALSACDQKLVKEAKRSKKANGGADLITVKELLGLSSFEITQRYTHSHQDLKKKAVAALVADVHEDESLLIIYDGKSAPNDKKPLSSLIFNELGSFEVTSSSFYKSAGRVFESPRARFLLILAISDNCRGDRGPSDRDGTRGGVSTFCRVESDFRLTTASIS